MRVTIVTPVKNGAAYLEAALDSVTRQGHSDWRHIVMDGGSTDATLDILARRAADEPRLTFSSRPDDGIYDALLDGFERADEGILGWLNSDDLLTPWAMSSAVRAIDKPAGPDWISGLPAIWDSNGELRGMQALGWRPRAAILRGWCHDGFLGCLQQESMFFRTSLFNKLTKEERERIRAQRLAGDFALWRAFSRHSGVTALPQPLGGFRVHGANLSTVHAKLYAEEVKALGGQAPPAWLAKRMRTAFEAVSSASNVWAFRRAMRTLHEQKG